MDDLNEYTVTDEQIRDLMKSIAGLVFPASGCANTEASDLWHACQTALDDVGLVHSANENGDCPRWCAACRSELLARGVCAWAINKRATR